MKIRHILTGVIILTALNVRGQNNNVQSAANSLKFEEIPDAKKYIDLAAENEATNNNPKMWFYKGKIYLEISKSKDEKIRALDPDAAEKSAMAFLNCLKTDTKETYKEDVLAAAWISGLGVFNKAVDCYNKNEYEKSNRLYKIIFDLIPTDKEKNLQRIGNITPEVLNKNIALTAHRAKDFKTAKEYFQKLIDAKYNDPVIYIYQSRIYTSEKDTAKALEILEKGKQQFEGNTDIANEEINLYIAKGNTDGLIDKFTKAIEANPEKELYYFNRAVLYEKKKKIDLARADYKKAIELNSEYFDAYYGLGAMMFNEGAELVNKANDMKDVKEYNKLKAQADTKFKDALPYLEKAHELNAKDKPTMLALKQAYARVGNNEKYNQIKAEMEGK